MPASGTQSSGPYRARRNPRAGATSVGRFGSDSIGQFWSMSRHSIILSTLGQSCPRTQKDCPHSCPETGMQYNGSGPRGVGACSHPAPCSSSLTGKCPCPSACWAPYPPAVTSLAWAGSGWGNQIPMPRIFQKPPADLRLTQGGRGLGPHGPGGT